MRAYRSAAARPSRVPGLLVAGACGALALVVVLGDRLMPPAERLAWTDLVWFGALLLYPLMGAVIVHHRPRHRIGWIFLAVGLCITAAPLLEGVSFLVGEPLATMTAATSRVLFGGAWALATTVALLYFPTGSLPSPRWRGVAQLAALGAGLVTAGALGVPGLETAGLLTLGAVTLASLISLVARWRRHDDVRQLSWVMFAVVVIVTAAGVLALNTLADGPAAVGVVCEALALAALPLATGVAIVRDRLFDIELVLNRSLVYLTLVVAVLAVFALAVLVATQLVGAAAGQGAALVAAVVVAVALGAVKDRLVAAVDRRLYGARSRPYAVLAGVAARLEGTLAVDELLTTAAAAVAEDLRLPHVTIQPHPHPHALDADGGVEVFDLRHGTLSEGMLVAGLRRGQSAFSQRERALLTAIARHLAVAVRAVRLTDTVEQARERLVRAREEERLRIRRDLHDGVGPTLAAVRLQVDTLGDRLAPADDAAHALLGRIQAHLADAVGDVRRAVEGLRPPALDQVGLVGVVRGRADDLRAAGLEVQVVCPDRLEIWSAAVEVAAYRIVTEALTNVVRHASARRCTVRLAVDRGVLTVEVADDGTGLPAEVRAGVGLASMAERAAELAGRFEVSAGPAGGGTVVRAELPLRADA
ncbi:sensor histidine kinase [Georgenia yuyongxinii]|uniref:Sensor histidine kinase n=1 Tax=Georgenia yuyongxinii TaxID=2589797 RepID=A0A552WPI0_9MICO|nr:sensor histidine kinase [Georgenia yuyongxinii]TRW44509.1 sensor histidine kinase [Georgenia yuyongxinii]